MVIDDLLAAVARTTGLSLDCLFLVTCVVDWRCCGRPGADRERVFTESPGR